MGDVVSAVRTVLCAVAFGVLAGAPAVLTVGAAPAAAQEPDPQPGVVLGSANATVTVVEFADFACSACAEFARDTWPDVRARFVETGRVRWRVVPFELGFRNSEEGARAGYCAAEQGRFWPMHDELFARREHWVGERRPRGALVRIAGTAGLDGETFEACYDDEDRTEDLVDRANDAAKAARVRATPTFLIDGVPVLGAVPFDAFAQLLERELAKGSAGGPRR